MDRMLAIEDMPEFEDPDSVVEDHSTPKVNEIDSNRAGKRNLEFRVNEDSLDDGYRWRKYAQKEMLNSKYPRCYFRCTHRDLFGCKANKAVQRIDDSGNFQVTYNGVHTCLSESVSTSISTSEPSGKCKQSLMHGYHLNPLVISANKSRNRSNNNNSGAINHDDNNSSNNIVSRSWATTGGGGLDDPARTLKRPRPRPHLVWTPQLHKRFMDAVEHLGIKNAVPKTIMQLMNVEGLTRVNVATHLQKFRLHLKRMQEIHNVIGTGVEPIREELGDSAQDHLFNSTPIPVHFLHPNGLGPVHGQLGSSSPTMVQHIVSTNGNLQRLLSAFHDVEVNKIGIYGSSGIGKTAVMKNFLSCYDFSRLFDLVFWVTVPKCSPRRKIQNALLQQLSMNVEKNKSDDEVATILHQTLIARKFVLLFDDVREHVDLPKVGIPSTVNTDFKIVLTTRSFHICESMGMDKIIEAEVLSKEQSLHLFRSHVGHVRDSQHIELYGRAIVDECAGLPLTIKVVGKALRTDSSILGWKCALKEILMSNNLQILKLGYDRLEEHDMRSWFLFSSLFTESRTIKISSLVEYLVDEGVVAGSMSHARRRGHDIVKHLIDVSLLECTDDGLMVQMHDLIRDLALLILSDVKGLQMLLSRYSMSLLSHEPHLLDLRNPTLEFTERTERAKPSFLGDTLSILKAGEGLNEPPLEEEWEDAKMVFLMDNNFSSLPTKPGCSELQTLFLQRNKSLRTIPSSFFEHMSSLQILNLSKTRIKGLPPSLSKLLCLQVLILRNCERLLFLPSAIGDLKHLLVLDVHGTEICQLPDQIGELVNLVHLKLSFYGSMDEDECSMLPSQLISKGVISKFSQLREFSINVYPGDPRWTEIASDVVKEVSNLYLCSLSFHFPEIKDFEFFINASPAWLLGTLTRFNFTVGHDVKRVVSHVSDDIEDEYNSQDRCLRFVDGEDIPDAIDEALYQATSFYLDHHQTAHSLTQFGWAAINGLKNCIVKDCPKLKAIINSRTSTTNCFPHLEFLSIHYCWKLSQIWVGPIRAGSLSMLRQLSLHSCPKLEFVLSRPLIAGLFNLEELVVVDCQSVNDIVSNQDPISAYGDTVDSDFAGPNASNANSKELDAKDEMEVEFHDFPELRIKVLKLHHLPKLENIWRGGDLLCLEYVSFYSCPKLRELDIKSHVEDTIKEIKTEINWWENLQWEDPALPAKLEGRVKEIQCDDIWSTM